MQVELPAEYYDRLKNLPSTLSYWIDSTTNELKLFCASGAIGNDQFKSLININLADAEALANRKQEILEVYCRSRKQ